MSDSNLASLKLDAYQQRRRVELLQTQLHDQGGIFPHLLEELIQAEESLLNIEQQITALAPPESTGVLLHTQSDSGGMLLGADSTGIEVQVLQRQSHIPTGIIHLLEPKETPLVTIRVRSHSDKYIRLKITTFVENYSAQAVDTVELSIESSAEVHHLPTFFPERLHTITELTRATLHVRIDNLDGPTEQYSTFPIWLLARDSAYNGIKDPATGQWIDLSQYLAAWVTPNAEAVQNLLRRAADLHPERRISGYLTSEADIEEQVKAVYAALKAEDILYINSIVSFGGGHDTRVQRVRLPRQTLQTKSANCIDGTVLMASALEAASLNPAIVVIPGHAFLGWETQLNSGKWDYLETTLVGLKDFATAQAKGRALAVQYHSMAERFQDKHYFQILAIPDLRVNKNITPME